MNKEILVIDDNPDIRLLVSNILKEQTFLVRTAANYDQAEFEINKKLPDLAIIDKRRPAPGKSEVMNIIGDVKNKTCIIVDDIIDSGGTIVNAVDALKKNGANEVYVFITHAVLSGDAVKRIKNSKIKKLIITDTIDNSQKIKNNNKIEVLSIASLMSEAIKRIANSNSVSDLFN